MLFYRRSAILLIHLDRSFAALCHNLSCVVDGIRVCPALFYEVLDTFHGKRESSVMQSIFKGCRARTCWLCHIQSNSEILTLPSRPMRKGSTTSIQSLHGSFALFYQKNEQSLNDQSRTLGATPSFHCNLWLSPQHCRPGDSSDIMRTLIVCKRIG